MPKMLTEDECHAEIDRVEEFFEQVPHELRLKIALCLIIKIVNETCGCFYHGLGLLTEATFFWRTTRIEEYKETDEEDHA